MLKKRKVTYPELAPLIEEAVRRLPDGGKRLSPYGYQLSLACRKGLYVPDLPDLSSVENVEDVVIGDKTIQNAFQEEVKVIRELLVERGYAELSEKEAGASLMQGMALQALAVDIWEWFAIPWRFKDGAVFVVSPPSFSPLANIDQYPAREFLSALAPLMGDGLLAVHKANRQRDFWLTIGGFAGFFAWGLATVHWGFSNMGSNLIALGALGAGVLFWWGYVARPFRGIKWS